MLATALRVEVKNELGNWKGLFEEIYDVGKEENYPVVVISDKLKENELETFKGKVIRFKIVEIDPITEDIKIYHFCELRDWTISNGKIVVYNQNRNVRKYTELP